MDYRDKVVLVTGASSGIGYATARSFARRGSIVVGVARREPRLRELARACQTDSPRSGYLAGDLAEAGFAKRAVEETVGRHGRLDVLVNNAAIPKHKPIYEVSVDEAEAVMRANFLAVVETTLAAIPHMLRQGGGVVVNVSSFATKVVPPREALYAASKCAVNGFTEGLWNDLAGSNIHAVLITPGAIDTEIWSKLEQPSPYRGKKHPPEAVAEAILNAIGKQRHEITVPRRSPPLLIARFLRLAFPALLRAALARMDPLPPRVLEAARARAGVGSSR